ncbi:MAG: hypothetical protein H6780_00895 [Candidatus Nomurabacteria bacterium]|nr:MAG: hypothetical protein H6780_00895 [Candidatus Nomurabacteria bacterium]
MKYMKIGCIGQGFVGKNIADNFEHRGYEVVRYSVESEYVHNEEKISECDVVFIAVPTPTTPVGFDYSIVEEVLALVTEGAVAVIKSTILPGTTKKLQEKYPGITVLFSPEFLCEKTAAYDVANPIINVVGHPLSTEQQKGAAERVLSLFPKSKYNHVVLAQEAELFKYAHNLQGYFRVILSNLLFEVGEKTGGDWEAVRKMMDEDVMMSPYYNSPIHKSGRGAGGACFIKDMAAFRFLYDSLVAEDKVGLEVLKSLEAKNLDLLGSTGKDKSLVAGVYGISLLE